MFIEYSCKPFFSVKPSNNKSSNSGIMFNPKQMITDLAVSCRAIGNVITVTILLNSVFYFQ